MNYEQHREEELKKSIIAQTKRDDFEAFWQAEMDALRSIPIRITRKRLTTPYDKTFYTDLITFTTHDDTVIDALFSCPVGRAAGEKLPCVAVFHGGSGYKDIYPGILATGVCCFAIDVRSQAGTTVDKAEYHSGDWMGGLMTRGVLEKNEFYMKNIYLDAARAIDVIAQLEEVDPERIVTYGGSQGGALAIAASALSQRSLKCYSIVTSYCCLIQRTQDGSGVFGSTKNYLRVHPSHTDKVFETLSYFDVNNLVSLLKTPTVFCLALADAICLPQYVYSAYAHADCPKQLMMYPFTPHCIPDDFRMLAYQEFSKL